MTSQALATEIIATSVTTGDSHSCALTTSGGVKCWGKNFNGQLGDGSTTNRETPIDVVGLTSGVVSIAAGNFHTCALTVAGGLKCWGYNDLGQVGDGTSGGNRLTPMDVTGLTSGVAGVDAGNNHTCALTVTGGIKCWGWNFYGQLGDGTQTDRLSPVDVVGLGAIAVATSLGQEHTCALTSGGGVKCWGANGGGQLGNGSASSQAFPVPGDVSGLTSGVAGITAGSGHTCAVTSAGAAKCWGANNHGQLGDDSLSQQLTPVDVTGLSSGVADIAAGANHTCAVTSTGAVKCWGHNANGQVGDNSTSNRDDPVAVVGLASGMASVATGGTHTCARSSGGWLRCWGANSSGQLGEGTTSQRLVPVEVVGPATFITAGYMHTCALTVHPGPGEGVQCWGRNDSGQLGDGNVVVYWLEPVGVTGLASGVAIVSSGGSSNCAVTMAGGAKCWGSNPSGKLGDGSTTQRPTPVDVSGLTSGVASVSVGSGGHSCALTSGGGVKCWGRNNYGQLGDGTLDERLTPVDVSGLGSGVAAVAAGGEFTCALMIGGGAKCWGRNQFGQLGISTSPLPHSAFPMDVFGSPSGVAMSAGDEHICVLTTTGGVKCWGRNNSGQIGDGSGLFFRDTPTDVSGLTSGVAVIAAGERHTCARTTGATVKCWGSNSSGQIGNDSQDNQPTPVDVAGFSNAGTSLAAGGSHTCATTAIGTVKCWGNNGSAQLGDGSLTMRLTPVGVANLESTALQSLTFAPAAAGSVGTEMQLTATATSGLTAQFETWTGGTCSIGGNSLLPSAPGLCGVRALQSGNSSYFAAPQQARLIVIAVGTQAIVFASLPNRPVTDAPFTVSATGGGSGNPVVFSALTPSICTTSGLNGSTVTLTGTPGTCTIAANQAGNGSYSAAPQVTRSFTALVIYNVVLEGAQEVPVNGSPANGSGTVTVDVSAKTLAFVFSYSGLTSSLTAAHFHGPAARGIEAGVKIDIGAMPASGTVPYSPADEGAILAGNWYINVHTATYAGGEIRGQLDNLGAAPRRMLTVDKAGTGAGTVAAGVATPGIACGATCSFDYPHGLQVSLTASASGGSTFAGWSGACSGSGECSVTMDAARNVTATFNTAAPGTFGLTVSKAGSGSGVVTSFPAGIDCGQTCSVNFNAGTPVTLNAVASAGSHFTGWSGACTGTGGCNITMDAAKSVTASFALESYALSVAKSGTGAGTVTSMPAAIDCGSTCSTSFAAGTSVTLNAAASAGSHFTGWSGACTGIGTCQVTMTSAMTVTANFVQSTMALTVTRSGSGSGSVSSVPVGIQCGTTCNADFNPGTTVTLTATPAANSSFAGWSGGGCSGTGQCVVSMNSATTVNAAFASTSELPRLVNISTRGRVGTGFEELIGGFVVGGSSKTVVIRAIGPSLANFGVAGALANPTLRLIRISDSATIASNDDWGTSPEAAQITAANKAPAHPQESAIYITLPVGAYTAVMSGVGGGTGVGLVEVYEVDHPEVPLINISTRGRVNTGFEELIGGFVVDGSGSQQVVIRAIGPSLTSFGVAGALADPTLRIIRIADGVTIATNDDWQSGADAAQITGFNKAPTHPKESALLLTLPPGAYTAVVSGVGGGTGVGLVEVYTVP